MRLETYEAKGKRPHKLLCVLPKYIFIFIHRLDGNAYNIALLDAVHARQSAYGLRNLSPLTLYPSSFAPSYHDTVSLLVLYHPSWQLASSGRRASVASDSHGRPYRGMVAC